MNKTTVFIASIALFLSCKKDPASCATTVASIAGSYKIAAYTYKQSASSPEIDYYPMLFPDACERDDVISFNADGTYQKTDVGMVCSPPENDNGTWSLLGNALTIDGAQNGIESFDCKTLVLFNTDLLISGDILKITLVK